MQALKLEAQYGVRWIVGGWRLLRKQPFSFIALLFLFWMTLFGASTFIGWVAQGLGTLLPFLSVDLIAVIGGLLFAALTPALTVGFLQGCRVVDAGLAVHPFVLFAPLRAERRTVVRLLSLGMIQMMLLVVILLATSGTAAFRTDSGTQRQPQPQTPAATRSADPASSAGTAATPAAPSLADEAEMRARAAELTTQALAYLPVALVMWYAPMLVAWHGLPVGKAIFFSAVGVWRNRAAFLVFGVGWLVIMMAASIVIGVIGLVVGVANLAALIVAPIAMLLLTGMYCSIYQSYATVYVEAPDTTPAVSERER